MQGGLQRWGDAHVDSTSASADNVRMWPPDELISEDEYLLREPEAEYKSEFRDGRVIAMTGASRSHIVVVGNLIWLLHSSLPTGCLALASEMRVKVEAAHFYTYPDIAIVCGEERYADAKQTTLLNPQVIIEVLSPSTAAYDRNEKFSSYQQLPSLQEYVLVSQHRMQISRFVRDTAGAWREQTVESPGAVLALTVGQPMPLEEIYRNVRFE